MKDNRQPPLPGQKGKGQAQLIIDGMKALRTPAAPAAPTPTIQPDYSQFYGQARPQKKGLIG